MARKQSQFKILDERIKELAPVLALADRTRAVVHEREGAQKEQHVDHRLRHRDLEKLIVGALLSGGIALAGLTAGAAQA